MTTRFFRMHIHFLSASQKSLLGLAVFIMAMVCFQTNGLRADEQGFSLVETPAQKLEIRYQGKPVASYQFAYDKSTPELMLETYKPFLHVMNEAGDKPITKGAGGQYTHHRGIFLGWNKTRQGKNSYDFWHNLRDPIVHQKFLKQAADQKQASFTALAHWVSRDGQPVVQEEKTISVRPGKSPVRLVIDLSVKLSPVGEGIVLDGDPEHAGVQYRAANEVQRSETQYIFPREEADPKKDVDYPWVGMNVVLDKQPHSVIHVNSSDNPQGTLYSAYRDYGRFGAHFVRELPAGESLTVKYRFLILDQHLSGISEIQKLVDQEAK